MSTPLARREFRLYFAGNLTSNIGSWLNNVVLSVFMYKLTRSSFWVGISGLGLALPVLVFALPVGVLADRVDRLKLLLRSQIVLGAQAIALTVLVATHNANRYVLAVLAFGFGVGVALAIPTMQALIPLLVPHDELTDAISLNALTFNAARVLGPLIAVVSLATLGPVWAFGFNAASYVVFVGALALIRRAPFPRERSGAPGPVREGVAYAWRHLRTRWMLLSIVAIGITLDPITTLSPALGKKIGLGENGAGWIVAAWGVGGVVMILFARRTIKHMTEHGLGWIGLVALAAGIAGLGATTNASAALAGAVLSGAGYITATMVFTTSIQRDVPETLRGRVSALWTLAFLGPRALVAVVDGTLADHVGLRGATAVFACVSLAAALALRRVQPEAGEPVPPPA